MGSNPTLSATQPAMGYTGAGVVAPGDEVDFELRGDAIVLTARRRHRQLGSRFEHSGMASRLLDDHATEPR